MMKNIMRLLIVCLGIGGSLSGSTSISNLMDSDLVVLLVLSHDESHQSMERLKEIREFFENGKADIRDVMSYFSGATALHWAAESGWFALVEFLCLKGANVNVQDAEGCTPLHRAAWRNDAEIVKYLLRCGANSNIFFDVELILI